MNIQRASIRNFFQKTSLLTVAIVLAFSWLMVDILLFMPKAGAAQITDRKLSIGNSANGSLAAGQNVTYTFTFTVPGAASTVQSMDFQFCSGPLPGTDCNIRAGQSVTSAAISGSPSGLTGWALGTAGNAPTNSWSNGTAGTGGRIRITRTNASNVGSDTPVTIAFSGITNPTTDNQAFFVRILTYTDTAWTTSRDNGSVANSTAQQIDITAKVQETLNFSVGSTPGAPGASCTAFSDSGALALGDATDGTLSFAQAYDAHSYFRISTNANGGTIIYYSGDTLKNGSNSIAAIGTSAAASAVGTAQFGLGIDSSDTQSGGGHSFTSLAATAPYNTGNGTITNAGTAQFAFSTASLTTPVQIASSSGTITCDTGSVRYLGNISTTTPPGIYTTTISYLAVPTY